MSGRSLVVGKSAMVGIRKEAWHQVAEKNNAVVSNAIVVDLVDKQKNSFAKRTFQKLLKMKCVILNIQQKQTFAA